MVSTRTSSNVYECFCTLPEGEYYTSLSINIPDIHNNIITYDSNSLTVVHGGPKSTFLKRNGSSAFIFKHTQDTSIKNFNFTINETPEEMITINFFCNQPLGDTCFDLYSNGIGIYSMQKLSVFNPNKLHILSDSPEDLFIPIHIPIHSSGTTTFMMESQMYTDYKWNYTHYNNLQFKDFTYGYTPNGPRYAFSMQLVDSTGQYDSNVQVIANKDIVPPSSTTHKVTLYYTQLGTNRFSSESSAHNQAYLHNNEPKSVTGEIISGQSYDTQSSISIDVESNSTCSLLIMFNTEFFKYAPITTYTYKISGTYKNLSSSTTMGELKIEEGYREINFSLIPMSDLSITISY